MGQLKQTLAALYEQGETTESIIKTILEDLTNSEKIEQANLILCEVEKDDNYYDLVNELVEEVANEEGYEAERLLDSFSDNQILSNAKGLKGFEDMVIAYASESEDILNEIAEATGNNIIIPAHMLDLEKRSRIQTFFENLFPYYNEQKALQLNF